MAFKPSARRQSTYAESDLDIRPIMNLMVVLIPLLLAGAQFVKNTILEVALPASKGASSTDNPEPKDEQDKMKNIQLTVTITKKGFYLVGKGFSVVNEKAEGEPTVPITGTDEENAPIYDYVGLRTKLKEIKEKLAEIPNIRDKHQITLTGEKDIKYEVIIKTHDTISGERVEGETQTIFPVVQMGMFI